MVGCAESAPRVPLCSLEEPALGSAVPHDHPLSLIFASELWKWPPIKLGESLVLN